jgi:hypothetical protein
MFFSIFRLKIEIESVKNIKLYPVESPTLYNGGGNGHSLLRVGLKPCLF